MFLGAILVVTTLGLHQPVKTEALPPQKTIHVKSNTISFDDLTVRN